MNLEIGEGVEGNVLTQEPGDVLAASEGKGKETRRARLARSPAPALH